MISKWHWWLRNLMGKLWVIAVLYALLAIASVFFAPIIGPLLPDGLGKSLGSGAVEAVLGILASSMLAVVTFSLGVMVSALSGAAGSVTPRATALLNNDRTTQRVLSTFLGSFLFSLIGVIALKSGFYSDNDRLVLFAATILVVVIIIVAILRWIAHLTVFGLMKDSIGKVEAAARDSILARLEAPFLGGHALTSALPASLHAVHSDEVGYVSHIGMAKLQTAAKAQDAKIYLAALPGAFVHPGAPIAWVSRASKDISRAINAAFTIETTRSFDQDPRFGVCVLAEIAQRALSPAVNDPGTAIDILGRAVRLISIWTDEPQRNLAFPLIWVPPLRLEDVMEDIFPAIASDGASIFSVQIRLQKALLALVEISPTLFGRVAMRQAQEAMARCRSHMLPSEVERLEAIVATIDQKGANLTPRPL